MQVMVLFHLGFSEEHLSSCLLRFTWKAPECSGSRQVPLILAYLLLFQKTISLWVCPIIFINPTSTPFYMLPYYIIHCQQKLYIHWLQKKPLIKFWGDISMLYQPTTYRTNKPKIQIKCYKTDDDIHILEVHRHI